MIGLDGKGGVIMLGLDGKSGAAVVVLPFRFAGVGIGEDAESIDEEADRGAERGPGCPDWVIRRGKVGFLFT
jgi:hypothetical protein